MWIYLIVFIRYISKFLLTTFIMSLVSWSIVGCASASKNERPHIDHLLGIHLATGTLTYILPVSKEKAHEALESVIYNFFSSDKVKIISLGEASEIKQYNRYSFIKTDYSFYEIEGRKYRKKCNGYTYIMPEQKMFTRVDVSCELDVYELGLLHGRGGIHNLFSQWWDWYPERGLYLAEDILEKLLDRLKITNDKVIKLNKKEFYNDNEVLNLIDELNRKHDNLNK